MIAAALNNRKGCATMAQSGKIVRLFPEGRETGSAELSELLLGVHYRAKHTLARIRALARLTLDENNDLESFYEAFDGRLYCLSRYHAFVGIDPDKLVDLRELLAEEFLTFAMHIDRDIEVEGPELLVDQRAGEALALAFHELAVNATTIAVVAHRTGHIAVRWQIEDRGDGDHLILEWRETGFVIEGNAGPVGLARSLIEEALPFEVGGTARLDFSLSEGMRCRMDIPLADRMYRVDPETSITRLK